MASTIPFQLVFPTELVDLIDAAWMGDVMPQDGERGTGGRGNDDFKRRRATVDSLNLRPRPPLFKNLSKKKTDDPLPPGVTLPPDDLDDFGGLGSVLSLGRGGGAGGAQGQGQGGGGGGGAGTATASEAWQDLALGELQ